MGALKDQTQTINRVSRFLLLALIVHWFSRLAVGVDRAIPLVRSALATQQRVKVLALLAVGAGLAATGVVQLAPEFAGPAVGGPVVRAARTLAMDKMPASENFGPTSAGQWSSQETMQRERLEVQRLLKDRYRHLSVGRFVPSESVQERLEVQRLLNDRYRQQSIDYFVPSESIQEGMEVQRLLNGRYRHLSVGQSVPSEAVQERLELQRIRPERYTR